MFKKIVSRLPFSPTLIGELGYYAKRLSKEEASRRLGLLFTALALVVQSFIVFSPPESANAAHASDLIYGGVHSKSQLLSAWDNNTQGYRELLQYIGVERKNLENAYEGEVTSRSGGNDANWMSWGRISHGSSSYNETYLKIGKQDIYIKSLAGFDTGNNLYGNGSYYPSFIGTNSYGERFVIIKNCANIAMKSIPKKEIRVCELSSRNIITIRENKYDKSKHSKKLSDCDDRPITVCELSTLKMITIDERDFNNKKHSKNPEDCQPKPEPIALCSSLTVKKIDRTKIEMQAAASTANGASVKSYTYIITDKNGKEVFKKTVTSSALKSSLQHNLTQDGTYRAKVIVSTSLGDKAGESCESEFTIDPVKVCDLNPSLAVDDPLCQPCPADPTIWVKDENCSAKIVRSKSAKNLTTNTDATVNPVTSGNRIEYILTAKNEGKADATFALEDNLRDVLEYADIYDRGEGELDEPTKVLSWGEVTLKPGEEQTRIYTVRIKDQLSPMPRGASNPTSYDCLISNTFGNTIEIGVNCPGAKVVEQVVSELPRTGATSNIIAGGIVAMVVTFLYFRSRQLNKEVRLIRREFTAGTI